MTFATWQLFLAVVGYLLVLFLIAYAAERDLLPRRVARHPLVYTLSLGVYATSWSFYGSVGFAQQQGFNFLTIYLGVTLAFLLVPVLLQPMLRLTREYQLASLADLFAFRYHSQLAGVLVTLFMLAGSLPYIALQVRAVTESLRVLTRDPAPHLLALGFCAIITGFAVLFGARHISPREKHEGLVTAIAFESLVKLGALLAVGLYAVFGVFDGPAGIEQWLGEHPDSLRALYQPVREGPWNTLLLLAFAAAFLLPRQFHMIFNENRGEHALQVAGWAFPLFLLLLNLAIPPILWAGTKLAPQTTPDFYVLGITLDSGSAWLPILTFLGGVSAASAMMIVTTLALAAMCMNHLLLPASFPPRLAPHLNIYNWLLWARRLLIAVIIAAGYGFYLLLERNQGLVQLGLTSFVAVTQFLPGIVGLLYWRRATRAGFIAGLSAGATTWAATLLPPLVESSALGGSPGLAAAAPADPWTSATFWSLSLNSLLFVAVSLLWPPSREEQEAAAACCKEGRPPPTGVLVAASLEQMREQLALVIGQDMARHEVQLALDDLRIRGTTRDPAELRQVREQVERNLSGLVGPLLARMIVDERLQMDPQARTAISASMRLIEQRLEDSQTQLRGLAAELDQLRRYHRQVLQDLPLGVCSVGPDREVVSWNLAMELLTGLEARRAVGRDLGSLAEPWSGLFGGFLRGSDDHLRKVKVQDPPRTRVFNLHKAAIEAAGVSGAAGGAGLGGTVILLEDLTDLHTLEAELAHSERLASIGRLAAGVAHEIGNPVTGIASLAQNLLVDRDDPELLDEGLRDILTQTRRISSIVRSLVGFSHSGVRSDHTPSPVSLYACVDEALRLLRLSRSGKQITFSNGCDPECRIPGDHQQLVQVFVNLLSNACDASRPGDRIDVVEHHEPGYLNVEVVDYGAGIPEELQEQVFEPFFTTKDPGEGTGLGLPLVYNIVREHSGTVSLHSVRGAGTRVRVRLPSGLTASEPARTEPSEE